MGCRCCSLTNAYEFVSLKGRGKRIIPPRRSIRCVSLLIAIAIAILIPHSHSYSYSVHYLLLLFLGVIKSQTSLDFLGALSDWKIDNSVLAVRNRATTKYTSFRRRSVHFPAHIRRSTLRVICSQIKGRLISVRRVGRCASSNLLKMSFVAPYNNGSCRRWTEMPKLSRENRYFRFGFFFWKWISEDRLLRHLPMDYK